MTNRRYKWLLSQQKWHARRERYYASPLIQTPAYRDAERWHKSQADFFQRQIMTLEVSP